MILCAILAHFESLQDDSFSNIDQTCQKHTDECPALLPDLQTIHEDRQRANQNERNGWFKESTHRTEYTE